MRIPNPFLSVPASLTRVDLQSDVFFMLHDQTHVVTDARRPRDNIVALTAVRRAPLLSHQQWNSAMELLDSFSFSSVLGLQSYIPRKTHAQ